MFDDADDTDDDDDDDHHHRHLPLTLHLFRFGWFGFPMIDFIELLCHHAPHGDDPHRLYTTPQGAGDGKAGPAGPSEFAAAFLCPIGIGCAQGQATRRTARTPDDAEPNKVSRQNRTKQNSEFVSSFARLSWHSPVSSVIDAQRNAQTNARTNARTSTLTWHTYNNNA